MKKERELLEKIKQEGRLTAGGETRLTEINNILMSRVMEIYRPIDDRIFRSWQKKRNLPK